MHFVQKLCILTSCFLITPWYDFQTRSFFGSTLSKLYAVFLLSVKIAFIIIMSLDDRNQDMFQSLLFTQKFFFVALTLLAVAQTVIQVVGSTSRVKKKWHRIICNLEDIDEMLGIKGQPERSLARNFKAWFVVNTVLFLAWLGPYLYFWHRYVQLDFVKFALFAALEIYNNYLLSTLLHAFLVSFETRYRALRKNLETVPLTRSNFKENLRIFRVLSETVECFNAIFGWQIIVLLLLGGLHLINSTNYTFVKITAANPRFHQHVAVFNLILTVIVMVSLFLVLGPCDRIGKEAQAVVQAIYKMQEKSCERGDQLRLLVFGGNFTENFLPQFNAMGFLKINRKTFFLFLGTVTTYVVVTFQFNDVEYQNLGE